MAASKWSSNEAKREGRENVEAERRHAENVSLLRALLDHRDDLTFRARQAFESMLDDGRRLTPTQELWVRDTAERLGLSAPEAGNVFSAMREERRREHLERAARVETPAVLRDLPKKPPGRNL